MPPTTTSPPRPGQGRRVGSSLRQARGNTKSTPATLANASVRPTKSRGLYGYVIQPVFRRLVKLMRSITSWQAFITVCLAFGAMMLALSGVATLGTLGLARRYTHVKSHIIRPLEFDYSSPIAVCTVSLYDPPPKPSLLQSISQVLGYAPILPEHHSNLNGVGLPADPRLFEQQPPAHSYHPPDPGQHQYDAGHHRDQQKGSAHLGLKPPSRDLRPLEPGQPVSVLLSLELPMDYVDLFQVHVELLSRAGKVVAQAARSYMPNREHWVIQTCRGFMRLPFQIIGWSSSNRIVNIRVIDRYVEQSANSVSYLRVKLSARNTPGGLLPPPPVFKGQVDIQLKLGVGRWVLAALAPSWMFNMLVGGVAVWVTLVGALTAGVLMCCAFVLHRLSNVGARDKASSREQRIAQELARMVTAARGANTRGGSAALRPAPQQLLEDVAYDHEHDDDDDDDDELGHGLASEGSSFGGGDDDSLTHGPPDLGRYKDLASKVSKGSLPELLDLPEHQRLTGDLRGAHGEIQEDIQVDSDEGEVQKRPSVFENGLYDDGEDSCTTPTAAAASSVANRSSATLSAHRSVDPGGNRSRPGSSSKLHKVHSSSSRLAGAGPGLDKRGSGGSGSQAELAPAEGVTPGEEVYEGGREWEDEEVVYGKSVGGRGMRRAGSGQEVRGKVKGEEQGVVMGGLFAALQQQVRQRPAAAQPQA